MGHDKSDIRNCRKTQILDDKGTNDIREIAPSGKVTHSFMLRLFEEKNIHKTNNSSVIFKLILKL